MVAETFNGTVRNEAYGYMRLAGLVLVRLVTAKRIFTPHSLHMTERTSSCRASDLTRPCWEMDSEESIAALSPGDNDTEKQDEVHRFKAVESVTPNRLREASPDRARGSSMPRSVGRVPWILAN